MHIDCSVFLLRERSVCLLPILCLIQGQCAHPDVESSSVELPFGKVLRGFKNPNVPALVPGVFVGIRTLKDSHSLCR